MTIKPKAVETQRVKVLAIMSNDMNLILGTYLAEGDNQLLLTIL